MSPPELRRGAALAQDLGLGATELGLLRQLAREDLAKGRYQECLTAVLALRVLGDCQTDDVEVLARCCEALGRPHEAERLRWAQQESTP